MRIGLLLCDHVSDEYNQIAGDYDEMFASMLEGRDVDLSAYDIRNGRLPVNPTECDGYLISGSRASVYEDERWIRDLEAFVRVSVDASVPIFGICFGLQVMATALGGSVEKSRLGWGVGVHAMTVAESRPWMAPFHETVSLVTSHQDQVTQLPTDAVVLGSSDHCDNFLVEFATGYVGIQGHPEFAAPFMKAIYSDRRDQLGGLAEQAIASLDSPTDTSVVVDWVLAIFSQM
ncbi:MAG: GMP synthase [Acidimicrobiia bacterium]|nr:MAG: GMP synthase [Acidimicrobiia bacterium]